MSERATAVACINMADNKEVAKPDHRRRVVMELIATEESYVKSLGVLVEKYHVPLKKLAAEGSPILTVAEMEVVFKNCDILFGLNKTLLSDLQAAGPGGDVGAIFKRFAPFLKMYHAYLDNNSVAMNLVATKLKAEAESNALLDIVTKGSQQPKLADFMASRGETLESLMIKPVQRLPRYKMLLEELLKPGCAACVSEEQNAAIRDALAKVAEVAAFCNTSIALHKEYMEWVELHLQFGEALPVNRDRQILREGTLSKWNRHGQAQRKYVILFSDALAYGKANTKGKLAKVRGCRGAMTSRARFLRLFGLPLAMCQHCIVETAFYRTFLQRRCFCSRRHNVPCLLPRRP